MADQSKTGHKLYRYDAYSVFNFMIEFLDIQSTNLQH